MASRRAVRLDLLVGNDRGLAFWTAVGFRPYAITRGPGPAAAGAPRSELAAAHSPEAIRS